MKRLYWRLIGWLDSQGHRLCAYYERATIGPEEFERQKALARHQANVVPLFDFASGTVTVANNVPVSSAVTYSWQVPPSPSDLTGEV